MSTFDPTKPSTSQSHHRGGRAITNALLGIDDETVSYLGLSERFRVSKAFIRRAVGLARELKAALSWARLRLVMDAEASARKLP